MTWSATVFGGALGALLVLALSGCMPSGQGQADEEKEPHYMAGKRRVSTLDYSGAIESFEKALEVNPRSAAAHFELACLFDQRETDPAAAIYHYQRYLKLRPDAGNADVVKQRIMTCKQELARNVSLGPLTERQQREFEQVLNENKQLSAEVKRLNDKLQSWQAYAAGLAGTASATGPPVLRLRSSDADTAPNSDAQPDSPPAPAPTTKTHTVKAGETPTAIARKYGLKVEVLMAANPGVNARRLQIGQELVIPVP